MMNILSNMKLTGKALEDFLNHISENSTGLLREVVLKHFNTERKDIDKHIKAARWFESLGILKKAKAQLSFDYSAMNFVDIVCNNDYELIRRCDKIYNSIANNKPKKYLIVKDLYTVNKKGEIITEEKAGTIHSEEYVSIRFSKNFLKTLIRIKFIEIIY